MLARTASWTTAAFVIVVFGALLLIGPEPPGTRQNGEVVASAASTQLIVGLSLVALGGALGAYVLLRNVRRGPTRGRSSRSQDI